MSEDYERRIRNLERVTLGLMAIMAGELRPEAGDGIEKIGDEFFYAIKEGGLLDADVSFELPGEECNR